MLVREKLGEIGAWAVSATTQGEPSKPIVSEKLDGLNRGAAMPTVVASTSDGFDWQDAGIGATFVLGTILLGAETLVTIRRHHYPPRVAH